ncbi:50S ribosomal protein L9 [Planctomicrobium piriforme]|uniref:Large ribosomal subunit protein bL9 n=1 Tax=Planctomicrobium piriforme TaxID=1576369 RepID=A0A1I3L967_9PLAN|nr:50S ribosomal protein L9 [Planctomicrobium piriforme]SFI80935.1 large subunit ribosomal protein L9 [Planctomicrobium piriforme]
MVVKRKHGQRIRSVDRKGGIELLLAEAVPNLGNQGEIVRVKPGYARNYLVPMGLATVATEANKQMVERHRKRQDEMAVARRKELQQMADKLKSYSVTLEAHATDDGHLYGSIGPADISKALKKANYAVEPSQVKTEGAIKSLGMYTIGVELADGVSTEIKVWVVPTAAIK